MNGETLDAGVSLPLWAVALLAFVACAGLAVGVATLLRARSQGRDRAADADALAQLAQKVDQARLAQHQDAESLVRVFSVVRDAVGELCSATDRSLRDMRLLLDAELARSRTETQARLEDVRTVVDEKLQTTLARQTADLAARLQQFDERFASFQGLVAQSLKDNADSITRRLDASAGQVSQTLRASSDQVSQTLRANSDQVSQALRANAEATVRSVAEVRSAVEGQLEHLRTENAEKLEQMRQTVDEKLQKTLDQRMEHSFRQVSDQLEAVYKGLGEMQALAQGVGDLRKVLSNVKTRGILGEIQLGAILKEILCPEQYDEDVATVPGSAERVEFAVRMPGDDGDFVYLPIDSKLPGDSYARLRDASAEGDAAAVDRAWRQLEATLKAEARDIRDKYVAPPYTTGFGIMFLPFEGLYAEVVNRPGLIEALQRDYRVSVAGPSTMAALLNSLQMGFQTVAIQRHADQIQTVLSAVKTEFGVYRKCLEKAHRQISTAGGTLDDLLGRRTRAMERKLRQVTELDSPEAAERVLGIDVEPDEVVQP